MNVSDSQVNSSRLMNILENKMNKTNENVEAHASKPINQSLGGNLNHHRSYEDAPNTLATISRSLPS